MFLFFAITILLSLSPGPCGVHDQWSARHTQPLLPLLRHWTGQREATPHYRQQNRICGTYLISGEYDIIFTFCDIDHDKPLNLMLNTSNMHLSAFHNLAFFEFLCSPGVLLFHFMMWNHCNFFRFLKLILDHPHGGQRSRGAVACSKKLKFLFFEIRISYLYSN